MISPSFHQLIQFVFQEELLEAFEVSNVEITHNARSDDETINIYLNEKNAPPIIPQEHRGKRIFSKGFQRSLIIQDFPIRSRLCALHINTRRWEIEDAGYLTRTLSFLPKEGLKLTTDFASFLKEADRTRTSRSRTHRETLLNQ